MNIGIIGAGNIGGTLGRKWAEAGHTVRFGVRNPGDPKFEPLHEAGEIGGVERAVRFGEVILLAQPAAAVPDFVTSFGEALDGKIVIDATNNVRSAEMNYLAVLAEKAPQARLARAFSTLGWENFAEPRIGSEQIDLFFCSQPEARETLDTLISAVGLRPIYIGGLEMAVHLDSMTRIWFALAVGQNYGRRIAFNLMAER